MSGYFDNCYGTFIWADGDQYVGGWKDDKKHGQGAYTWADGPELSEQYKHNRARGQTIFIDASGKETLGEWKLDMSWNAVVYDAFGNIAYSYKNGVLQ